MTSKRMIGIAWVVACGALLLALAAVGCNDGGPDTGTTGRAVECSEDDTCPGEALCVRGYCMPDCTSDADCSAGVCVDGVCVFTPEPWTCAADTDCPAGTGCVAGVCVADPTCVPAVEVCDGLDNDCDGVVDEDCPCAAGEAMCGGACVDVLFDELNCGACGMACAAGEACLRGVCMAGACVTDSDCDDGDPATVDTCVAGVCEHGSDVCPAGMAMCGGACVDLTNDAANCGACGMACAAGMVCNEGVCTTGCSPTVEVCDRMDNDCDGLIDEGGVCDETCVTAADCDDGDPSTADYCMDGVCVHGGVCGNGIVDAGEECDDANSVSGDGCEPDCTLTCRPAVEICDGIDNDCDGMVDEEGCACAGGEAMCGGVCVDVLFNDLNCGACGVACPAGQTCERGICLA